MTPPLSLRQEQIIHLISHGLTDKAIAARLGIAEATVGHHVTEALKKLGAHSRSHAVRRRYLK